MNQNKLPRLQHTEAKEVEFVKIRLLTRVPEWKSPKNQKTCIFRPIINHESRYRKPNIYQSLYRKRSFCFGPFNKIIKHKIKEILKTATEERSPSKKFTVL